MLMPRYPLTPKERKELERYLQVGHAVTSHQFMILQRLSKMLLQQLQDDTNLLERALTKLAGL